MKLSIQYIERGSGLNPSIPFLRDTPVHVVIDWENDVPSPIKFTVEGASNENGMVEIVSADELVKSGTITLRGISQTEPQHSGQVYLRASWNAQQMWISNCFSVCAHPNAVWNGPECLPHASADVSCDVAGMLVQIRIISDSGDIDHLSLVHDLEVVSDLYGYKGPGSVNWNTAPQTGKVEPIRRHMIDTHTIPLAVIKGHAVRFQQQPGQWRNDQLDVFCCPRCGMNIQDKEAYVVIPNSGFTVERNFSPSLEGRMRLTIRKYPASVQIGSNYSDAGPGETLESTLDVQDRILSEKEVARSKKAVYEMPDLRRNTKNSESEE